MALEHNGMVFVIPSIMLLPYEKCAPPLNLLLLAGQASLGCKDEKYKLSFYYRSYERAQFPIIPDSDGL